jgi:hypothetical protein
MAMQNRSTPPRDVMPRVDYPTGGYPEEQIGGTIPYGITGQIAEIPQRSKRPSMFFPSLWQAIQRALSPEGITEATLSPGGRVRPAPTGSVDLSSYQEPQKLSQTWTPSTRDWMDAGRAYPVGYGGAPFPGYPEEDIGAGAGLYPAYEPVPPATPEAIEEEKEVVDTAVGDDLKTQEKSELHDIIDRAYKGEFGAVDDQAIEGMLESLRKRLFALYESPDSFTGDPPLMKPSVLSKTLTLQNSIDSLEGFRDRMSDINAAYQTEAQRMASVELATELGRGLFPNLFPEGGQISFNDLNLLLQLAEFRRKEAVLAKAPDVTIFRGFEGGRTPTRGMMA